MERRCIHCHALLGDSEICPQCSSSQVPLPPSASQQTLVDSSQQSMSRETEQTIIEEETVPDPSQYSSLQTIVDESVVQNFSSDAPTVKLAEMTREEHLHEISVQRTSEDPDSSSAQQPVSMIDDLRQVLGESVVAENFPEQTQARHVPDSGYRQTAEPYTPQMAIPGTISGFSNAADERRSTLQQSPFRRPGATLQVGDIVRDKYRIVGFLGQGAFGIVYKVENIKLSNKLFAMKVLTRLQKQYFERFTNEVKLLMELNHEHTVPIREYDFTEEGWPYFTMNYHPGKTLSKIIEEEKTIPQDRALRIAKQVLSALRYAHNKGIVHRDLKPDNILIERRSGNDHALVLDFGIAKVLDDNLLGDGIEQSKLTGESVVIGTACYMSPEQANSDPVDKSSDFYSLGVVMYEMVTGQPPFRGDPVRVRMQHIGVEAKRPSKINKAISREIEKLLARAMAKDPKKRFRSADHFIEAIEEVLSPSNKNTGKIAKIIAVALLFVFVGIISFVFFHEQKTYSNAHRQFTTALEKKDFSAAQSAIGQVAASWLYNEESVQMTIQLHEAQKAQLQSLFQRGQQAFAAGEFVTAIEFFERAEGDQKAELIETSRRLLSALALLKEQRWQIALEELMSIEKYRKARLSGIDIPFLRESIERCQHQLHAAQWQQHIEEGQRQVEEKRFSDALQSFQQADSLKKGSSKYQILALTELISVQEDFAKAKQQQYSEQQWQQLASRVRQTQQMCKSAFNSVEIPFFASTLAVIEKHIADQARQKAELERKKEVQRLFASLAKTIKEQDWAAVPAQLKILETKVKSSREKRKLAIVRKKHYPPMQFVIWSKDDEQSLWRKATKTLRSGCLYQLRLKVLHPVYVYGFQRENDDDKLYGIFPKNPFGGPAFRNPVPPGEYTIPSRDHGFRLDKTPGVEHFYFLYSKNALPDAERALRQHLAKSKPLVTLVTQTFVQK